MSSDPNKSMTGELGEGTGIRDNENAEFKKTEELLEESLIDNDKPQKTLILIGSRNKIRCHRCATAKNDEDKGKFIQINAFIAWFHNIECHDLWIEEHGTNFKTGSVIDEYGKQI